MRLLIDGYNLLYTVCIPGFGHGIPRLARSRLGLLKRLADLLAPAQRAQTLIVFDARNAPPGIPRQTDYCGLTVRFATGYPDADSLIEELIEDHPSPRSLTVVSSDRRIQHAARRRKAKAVDSESWYNQHEPFAAAQPPAGAARSLPAPKPGRVRDDTPDRCPPPILPDDVLAWLDAVGGLDWIGRIESEENAASHREAAALDALAASQSDASSPQRSDTSSPVPKDDAKDGVRPFDFPFPPGYGDDVELE